MNRCASKASCVGQDIYQDYSAWLEDPLRRNLNLDLEELKGKLTEKGVCGVSLDDIVYVYVVTTTRVAPVRNSYEIRQEGCGPNFEGGIITLTTCKHYMRSSYELKGILDNGKLWIAGVTSKSNKKNPLREYVLFYLMKVDSTIIANSFYDLWNQFNQVQNIRNIKDACNNPLGDLYRPKSNCNFNVGNNKWDLNCYYPPCRNHVHVVYCHNCWIKDISYCCSNNRRPLLLVGENPFMGKKKDSNNFNSYLWTEAKIKFVPNKPNKNKNFRTMKLTLQEFLHRLGQI